MDLIHLHTLPRIYDCEPEWKWSPAPLKDHDLWIVLSGRGELEWGGQTFALRAGSAFIFGPGARLTARHDPAHPLRVFASHFSPRALELKQRLLSENLPGFFVQVTELPFLDFLTERCAAASNEASRSIPLYGISLLQTLILHLLESRQRGVRSDTDQRIDRLRNAIRQSPATVWKPDQMARETGLSLPQFNRRFRALAGISVRQFVIRQRVERAIQLLEETDLTIAQIADTLGYSDPFFFHRQFRKVAAVTPQSVRRGSPHRLAA